MLLRKYFYHMLMCVKTTVISATLLSFLMITAVQSVENKKTIGVIDYPLVFTNSKMGENEIKKINDRFMSTEKELKEMQELINTDNEKLERDKFTLTASQHHIKRFELRQRVDKYQFKHQQYMENRGKEEAYAKEKMDPLIKEAANKVLTQLNLDLIIERGATLAVHADLDVTRKLIQQLDKEFKQ